MEGVGRAWRLMAALAIAGAGAYVLYTGNASRAVTVRAEGASPRDASLTVLRRVTVLGAPKAVTQGEPTTRSFDLARVPMGVGLYVAPDEEHVTMTGPYSATLAGPQGEVLALDSRYGANCFGCGPRGWMATVERAPLVTGRYEASFESVLAARFYVGEELLDYVR